jgi:hypothetical protein
MCWPVSASALTAAPIGFTSTVTTLPVSKNTSHVLFGVPAIVVVSRLR